MLTAAKGRVADIANAIERKIALKRDPAAEEDFVFSTKAVRTMGGRQVPDDFPVPDHRSYEFKRHYIEITIEHERWNPHGRVCDCDCRQALQG